MKKYFPRVLSIFVAVLFFFTFQSGAVYAVETSDAPVAGKITVTNNVGKSDTVTVSGLAPGDTAKVYTAASAGKLLGSVKAGSTKTEVTITISQLGSEAGSIYVSVTTPGLSESSRVKASYSAEPQSEILSADCITVSNNADASDTVVVTGLSTGDTIKVYNATTDGKQLGTAKVTGIKTSANVTISQLGSAAGYVYVTRTCSGENESERLEVEYPAEPQSSPIDSGCITFAINSGKADIVYVSGVSAGDTIRVYNASVGGKLLGSVKVAGTKTEATITIAQLGTTAGSVYVTVAHAEENESARVRADYPSEIKTEAIDAENVTVTNNAGTSDTVKVSWLLAGDVVKVYSAATGGILLGNATVGTGKSEATITIAQLGSAAGVIYVSVANANSQESGRTKISYTAESKSGSLDEDEISITNNPTGTSDTVAVTSLTAGDIIKVYDASSAGNLLGSATVATGKTTATVTIAQLGTDSGSVYVSVTGKGNQESSRVEAEYDAEAQTDKINTDDVVVKNNVGSSDIIQVSNLSGSDVVKAYSASKGGTLLGSATASSSKTTVTITISQLGTSSGNVYISKTSKNQLESKRVKIAYSAEAESGIPDEEDVIITNNPYGTSDTIEVINLTASDVISVYDAATGGDLLGTATVASGKTKATVTVAQLGADAGSVYISVTSSNKQESDRFKVEYSAEAVSDAPDVEDIIVSNNSGTSDTVEVTGLTENDVVTIYNAAVSGKQLGTATVASSSSSVTITISQLATAAGSIYVTVTSEDKLESERTQVVYSAEGVTAAPSADNIIVTNSADTSDTVQVTGLSTGYKVNVYETAKGGTALGTATLSSGTYVTITISQLGTEAGTIYVTLTDTKKNKQESARTAVDYSGEGYSAGPSESNIKVTNKYGASDTIEVTGLATDDVVTVYDKATGGSTLGTGTKTSSSSTVTVTIDQLGETTGTVYVTVTSSNKLESGRTAVAYSAEAESDMPSADNIVVTNNADADDTVQVSGLLTGDVVTVYDASFGGNVLGSATLSSGTDVTITISQLGTSSGTIYVTVTSTAAYKSESDRTAVAYSVEGKSDTLLEKNVVVTNNPTGTEDTVLVSNVSSGDIIKVYDAAKLGSTLGTATASTSSTKVTVSITQLGTAAGNVYVSVTGKNKTESDRLTVAYSAESQSTAPSESNITITNNAGTSDTIVVTNLSVNDVVTVYDAEQGGTTLGTATVASSGTKATVTISQLGTTAGSVYISVTSTNKLESERTKADYKAETQTAAPDASNITITNNAGTSDTVVVKGLSAGNVVNIYDSAKGGTLLGTATVSTYSSKATVTVTQLGSTAGSVYVTVTGSDKQLESERTQADYSAEPVSTAPNADNITIVNNSGIAGTVTVTGLKEGDEVNVYDAATLGNLLCTGTVASYATEVTISVSQLGSGAGSVYVTVTSTGKLESERTEASYTAPSKSDAPDASEFTITNNYGIADTIVATAFTEGDVIKVYSSAAGTTKLGTGTVASDSTEVTISISQLGTSSGTVYISLTGSGKTESARTAVEYTAEQSSTAPLSGNITILNYADAAGSLTVTGLAENDVVKVYAASTGGTALGSATLESGASKVTISVPSLGNNAGSLYVSVTGTGKKESSRTQASYAAVSTAPSVADVTIINNAVISDTITVSGLTANDLVKVYDSALSTATLMGKATVASGSTSATVTLSQLTTTAGSVYITVTSYGKTESSRVECDYVAEGVSNAPALGNIIIVNNSSVSDTVTVTHLTAGDVIKVYDSSSGGTLLGSATVATNNTSATVTITQLGTSAGTVYISVTISGKTESSRTQADYVSESTSGAPYIGYITIVNNPAGTADTITVTNLDVNDVVTVYDASLGGNQLGTATVASGSTPVTIKITQLGTDGGSVHISVTEYGKTESERTEADYSAE